MEFFFSRDAVKTVSPGTLLPVWPLLLFSAPFLYKLFFLLSHTGLMQVMGFPVEQVVSTIVINDISLFCLIVILAVLCRKPAGFYLIPLIIGLCIFYFSDFVLFQSMHQRLTYIDIYKFYDEPQAVASFFSVRAVLIVLTALLLIWFVRGVRFTLKRGGTGLLIAAALVTVFPWLNIPDRPVDPFFDLVTSNVLMINRGVVIRRGIETEVYMRLQETFPGLQETMGSAPFERPAISDYDDRAQELRAVRHAPPDIILLLSESLSQVDSLRSNGIFDRLPLIDEVLSGGLTLRNVVSNGNNTSDALASLLTGIEPLPTPLLSDGMLNRFPVSKERGPAKPFRSGLEDCGHNLVCHAESMGYRTLFITNSPLSFQQNGEWLAALGFDLVEGSGSEYFSGYPRYTFGSPADDILYQRVLERVSEQSTPFFIVVMTLSLHNPYLLPDERDRVAGDPQASQLRYVDRTTAELYDELKALGYFDNGVLLITGDHRRMTPMEKEELTRRGVDSLGRVVTGIVGRGFNAGSVDDSPLNHSDLSAVLYRLMGGNAVSAGMMEYYNKGYLLGIDEPFTVHLVSDSSGLILIRRPGKAPWMLQLHHGMDPMKVSADPVDRDIAAYLALSSGWLAQIQRSYGTH